MLAINLLDGIAQQAQQTGPSTMVVWLVIILMVVIIVATLMIRSSRTPRVEEPEPVAVRATAPPVPTVTSDDLTVIEGIGPKIAAVLITAGIATFDQLAATEADRLQEILDGQGLHLADPSTWAEQARLAAADDQEGLRALQGTLKAGRAV